nr:hypothetical protein [Pseudofrankia sp. DC12]
MTRAPPSLVTVAGWAGCDHTGPVHEGDTLRGEIVVEELSPLAAGGGRTRLRTLVRADAETPGGQARDVLDWRFIAVFP